MKVWQCLLALPALALAACTPATADLSPPTQAQRDYYVVHNDNGGFLPIYAMLADTLTASGTPVRFTGEFAASGATFLIGVPGSCTEPGVTFYFHGASRGGQHDREASQETADRYCPALRRWFRSGPINLHGTDAAPLSAADVVAMCPIEFCGVGS